MKILVVGSGGREHAMAWRISKTPLIQKVYVAPGNGGTALDPELENLPITDIEALADFAEKEHIHLTVVGPEAPLAAGIVNVFRQRGLRIFGPSKEAAQLESSKDFAKAFMKRHGIPTADYQTFTDVELARAYIRSKGAPIVVKADGLAAGKGVVVATTEQEALDAVDMMLLDNKMGNAGARVVIEEFLQGEEASFIVVADEKFALPMATSQDHKRLLDADQGPNTGGMGAYSPAPVITPKIHAKVMREVIMPTINGMRKDGIPYSGFLYAGLMVSPEGDIKTLEFNCRMGDPETQPIMMRLKSDFVQILDLAVDGKLDQAQAEWDRRFALGVVLAAANYPETPRKGDVIGGQTARLAAHAEEDAHVFHAGTVLEDGQLKTSGGRVLCVTALGDSAKMAQKRAYEVVADIAFDGMQYRKDIGHLAINRKT
jgi:phosphoribosylamine--glycine ligase